MGTAAGLVAVRCRVLDLLGGICEPDRLITFARAVSTPEEHLQTVRLAEAQAEMADMRTVVLLGSSRTRAVARDGKAPFVYTPRSVPG